MIHLTSDELKRIQFWFYGFAYIYKLETPFTSCRGDGMKVTIHPNGTLEIWRKEDEEIHDSQKL